MFINSTLSWDVAQAEGRWRVSYALCRILVFPKHILSDIGASVRIGEVHLELMFGLVVIGSYFLNKR